MFDFIPVVGDIIEGAFNAAEAQENRDWQANMSQSAHQREVDDLRAAGLNPVLSANHGASTPGGASAQAPDISSTLTSSTMGRERLKADIEAIKAQVEKTRAETSAVQQGVAINKPYEDFSQSVLAKAAPYVASVLGLGGATYGATKVIDSFKGSKAFSAKSRWRQSPASAERALGKNGKTKAQNRKDTAYKRKKGSLTEQFHRNFPEW